MIDENSLLELGSYIVKTGQLKGASDIEVLARSINDVDINIESGEISGGQRRYLDQISIRLYLGKKMGSAFTNIPTRKAADDAVSMAIASAEATTEDKDWFSLPLPQDYPIIEGLWDEGVASCESSKVTEIAMDFMTRAINAEQGLIAAFGGAGISVHRTAYTNSNGIENAEKGNAAYAFLAAIAQIEGGVTPEVLGFDVKRCMDLDLNSAVKDLSSLIRICKKRAEGRTGEHTVVMHPWAYGRILQYTLMESVKGSNVARGKSKLKGRIGEKIASEAFTLIDDGTDPRGLKASIADDEGVPRKRTAVIEKGVLRSFLWDTYWANKMGEESTGNASRSLRQGLVEINPTNSVVSLGTRGIEDIISEIDHGYLIRNTQGAHSSNPESGDFSVVGNPAILIEDGELLGAVHGLMISGNAFDLLRSCVEASKEPHVLENLIGPELVFEDLKVIAR